jgi:hypothetical protein
MSDATLLRAETAHPLEAADDPFLSVGWHTITNPGLAD